jgi:acyl-CoA reductase-like NAD-dependent aldehyde dehydrogenase
MEPLRENFSRLIAQEGGKPLGDATVEVNRAIDGVRNAAEELRTFARRKIPSLGDGTPAMALVEFRGRCAR